MHYKTMPITDKASPNLSYVLESLLGEHRIYAHLGDKIIGYWRYRGEINDLLDAYRVLQLFNRNDLKTAKLIDNKFYA